MTKNLLLCLPSSLKQFVMNSTKILSSHIYSFFSFCKYIFSLCLGWTLDFERKKADQKPICGVKVWNMWVCTQNVQVQMWGEEGGGES